MPNGRSGGFLLDTADLKHVILSTSQAEVVAHVVRGPTRPTPSTAAELVPLVDECQHERVAVEEQDGAAYLIHVSNDPILWILVKSDSPMLAALRAHHSQWKTEHPDWKGWIAF
jgi:hypothetical protein